MSDILCSLIMNETAKALTRSCLVLLFEGGEYMKITKLDLSVTILATLSCILMYLQIPVWALFIGWAWYYALGSDPSLIKKGILPLIAGSLLAFAAFALITLFTGFGLPGLLPTIIAVFITVLLLMISLKIEIFNISLISFNAYSCIFVGFGAGSYMAIEGLHPYLNAFIWITGANFLGLIFGWLSIAVTSIGTAKKD